MSTAQRPAGIRRVALVMGALALVIAGVVSFYASAHPDGLEHVAATTGFLDTAQEPASAGGPLAGYAVKGVADARLSGGLAGVIGVAVTLVVAGGLALLVRRRAPAEGPGADPERT